MQQSELCKSAPELCKETGDRGCTFVLYAAKRISITNKIAKKIR